MADNYLEKKYEEYKSRKEDVRTIRTMVGKQPLSTKPGESL